MGARPSLSRRPNGEMQDGPQPPCRPAPPSTTLTPAAEQPPSPPPRRLHGPRDNAIHATVSLPPLRPARTDLLQRGSLRVAPPPGNAVRSCSIPVPPPRPENTLSPFTRDLTPPPERPKKPQQQQLPRPPLQPVAVLQQQQQQIQQSLVAMPATAVTPPTAAAMTTVHSQITLSEPRPGQERTQNVYVDAPLPKQQNRAAAASGRSGVATASEAAASALPQSEAKVRRSAAAREGPASVGRRARTKASEAPPPKKQLQQSGVSPDSSLSAASTAVPEPPISVTKAGGSEILSPPPLVPPDDEDSIICRRCGRCRCYACRAPRRLPERWLCNNAVHVSASSLVSCLSCMCAADAVLYHCGKDTLEDSATGNVKGGKWRWVCAAALSLVFPCLCCFLPLKGCQKVTEAAYAKATSNGCRCEEEGDGGRRKNVITSVPASPLTTFSSSVTAASVISSPSTSGGGGGATGEKNNDLFEQRLLL